MDVTKPKNFIYNNIYPIILFLFFFSYYLFWIKYNLPYIESNNNDLNTAINIFHYSPYVSVFLNNIITSASAKIFLGYCLFPSLVSVIIFMIFKKILSNNIWSFSLAFLSLTATENFPFIKFLLSFFRGFDFSSKVNLYENFEIMGFPIPSFSIFFFCVIFYLSLKTIQISNLKIYFITLLWLLMFHIHPVDGVIGNFYWVSLVSVLYLQKKTQLKKKDIFFLSLIFIINIFIVLNQLNFDSLEIKIDQSISLYSIFFYFIFPIILMGVCFKILKIDPYEFNQKFLNIYLLMLIELVLVVASLNGLGLEIQMLENRITMFLLHFLYYVPIIYYLSKDEIFYLNSTSAKSNSGKLVICLYYIFNKYKNFYLLSFVFLIIIYLFLSLKI